MKKLCALALLLLSGCVIAPAEYPVGYSTATYVEPVCCTVYLGVPGFWYAGKFYEQRYYFHGFRGGVPYRFAGPVHGPRGRR
jgi:hypothetical protein